MPILFMFIALTTGSDIVWSTSESAFVDPGSNNRPELQTRHRSARARPTQMALAKVQVAKRPRRQRFVCYEVYRTPAGLPVVGRN